MVLRMEPPESVVETSRLREFELIQALDGVVPVPPCYWVDADGECLPHPALIYGFVTGVTRPSSLKSTQRSEEHTSELQSLMRISYAVFCLKKKTTTHLSTHNNSTYIIYTSHITNHQLPT